MFIFPWGGNRVSKVRKYFNLLITFLVSGLWHGANWTFVIWGGINGLYQVATNILKINPKKNQKNKFLKYLGITITFLLICFAWIFFRANSLSDASTAITRIFTKPGNIFIGDNGGFIYSLVGLTILLGKDIYDEFLIKKSYFSKRFPQYLWYTSLVILILLMGVFDGSQFIYFQF